MAQTPARSVESKDTNELFESDPTPNVHGDEGATPQEGQAQSIGDESHPVKEAKPTKKVMDEEALVDQP